MSVPLQICNGTDISGIILAHIPCLMGADFCVWCGICAKYLAFGTYPTSTMGALMFSVIPWTFFLLACQPFFIYFLLFGF